MRFRMTVIDDKDPPTFGGLIVSADCATRTFLRTWTVLRKKFPAVWLHGPDCRMYSPDSFESLVET